MQAILCKKYFYTWQLRNSEFYLCTYVTLTQLHRKKTYYELHKTTEAAMRWDKNYFNQK